MMASVNLKWTGGMSFEGDVDGHKIPLDLSVESGGGDTGPRPKKLLLLGLAGCTAIDVVSLLNKMRVEVSEFAVDVEASQTESEHPHVYERYKVVYRFKGKGLNGQRDKIDRAVTLSQDKYCGVSAMLRKTGPINYEVVVEE